MVDLSTFWGLCRRCVVRWSMINNHLLNAAKTCTHVVTNFVAALMEKWMSRVIKIEDWLCILCGWWWAHNTAKTCETAVTGHGVTSGLEFRNRTRTRGTCGCDTVVLPIPMLYPKCMVTEEEKILRYQFESRTQALLIRVGIVSN
jgi:hypothetical protein